VFSGRIAARWNPIPAFDATLTYFFQNADYGGRTVSGKRGLLQTGDYEAPLRVLEFNTRNNQLLTLEMSYDLGWADLISATGASEYEEFGQRDQTDLLIGLEYSYEAFPTFTGFTREHDEEETVTQEVRLVSKFDSPFSFILGGFYNHFDSEGSSREFTPIYDEFLSGGANTRPDDLEYLSVDFETLIETAVFGEASYQITPNWSVTGGLRWYDYTLETQGAVDLPLFNSTFGDYGPNEVRLDFEPTDQSDDGVLYKFNTSYNLTDDAMVYFTASQGYRIGNSNGLETCPDPLPPSQTVCASPGEEEYVADKTTNYELGARTRWLDGALTLNGSIFYIDWTDPQVTSSTKVGLQPITVNAAGAKSQGFDISADWDITEHFNVRGAYAFTQAELTDLAPRLIREIEPPGFTPLDVDGQAGDRLPGSPESQGSVYFSYEVPEMAGFDWTFNYGVTYTGDVITRTGGRGDSTTLDAYSLHNASIEMQQGGWTVALYAKNLLDEFVETSARGGVDYNQYVFDADGGQHAVRTYYTDVLPPRTIGIRFVSKFGAM